MNDAAPKIDIVPAQKKDSGQPLKFVSIRQRLMMWFLVLSLLPLCFVSWFNYNQTKNSLSEMAADNLEQSAELSVAYISNWFENRQLDVSNQAELNENVALLQTLQAGFEQSGKSLGDYIKSFDWQRRIDTVPNGLVELNRRYNYIYDLFLIDKRGNILYTVERESDWGTNIYNGVFSQTGFAKAIKKTLKSGQVQFSGMERYFPSDLAIAGFITAPILDESGDKAGVFAMQLRFDRLFSIFQATEATEATEASSLHHYIVGSDGYLRTPLRHNNWREVLARDVSTTTLSQYTQRRNDDSKNVSKVSNYLGPEGKAVLGQYQTVKIGDINWILVSEINAAEAFSDAAFAGKVAIILMIITAIVVAFVAALQAQHFIRPIARLAQASLLMAEGESQQKVRLSNKFNDEITQLSTAFNHMLTMRSNYEQALEQRGVETQAALDELSESSKQLELVIDSTDVGVWDWDMHTSTVSFNESWAKIMGYKLQELQPINIETWIAQTHPEDGDVLMEKLDKYCNGEIDSYSCEVRLRHKLGYWVWVRDSGKIVEWSEDGKPTRMIGTSLDINDHKVADAKLQQTMDDLTEKHRQLEQEEMIAKHVFENITASSNEVIPELVSWCEPMGSFSGDMILSSILEDGGLRVILCDFTGHGLPAALGAVPVSSIYAAVTSKNLPLEVLMGELNNKLNSLLPTGMFCCIAGIDLNATRTTAQIWNSGVPDVLLVSSTGAIRQRFPANHLPLGVMTYEQEEMQAYEVQLETGDNLYIYSDGLTEAENNQGDMFGQDRLELLLQCKANHEGRLENIKKSVRIFTDGAASTDDVSMIEIKTLVT